MQVVEQALQDAGMHKDAIDFLVLHQANQRILDSAAQRLGVPSERVVSNLAGGSMPWVILASCAAQLRCRAWYLQSGGEIAVSRGSGLKVEVAGLALFASSGEAGVMPGMLLRGYMA